jgi:glycosyltransferase involved in cell wall biosynthesis/predicted house-cleaning noncanonical NTP pyrophosphatase (MazG superfamily)
MILHIITRCSKPANLLRIKQSITEVIEKNNANIKWHIAFDTDILKDIDAELLEHLDIDWINMSFRNDVSSYMSLNSIIKNIEDEGFVYLLNDNNVLQEDLYNRLLNLQTDKDIFVFSQQVGSLEGTSFFNRIALPENIAPTKIDGQQYVVKLQYFKDNKFVDSYLADGLFIETLYQNHTDLTEITQDILAYGNALEKVNKARHPRILYIGEGTPILKTNNPVSWEADELEVRYLENDSEFIQEFMNFKPDAILTIGDEISFENLYNAPLEIRKSWINLETLEDNAGEKVYEAAMFNILQNTKKYLVSFFTPVYNTKQKLYKTYESLRNQTYSNWEWTIVNDSTDNGLTLKIAESIAKVDPRVKVYDFREKSSGLIGEVKWRAACMTTGEILAELDHDDYLTPDCAEYLMKAAERHLDCGFFYSDCVESREDHSAIIYGEGFGCGYGAYKKEEALGRIYDVSIAPNINPKTIRHIVGIPNHIRAWRRDAYFLAGGHCRSLTIADDYELIIRTFLTTKMLRIPKLLYVQYFYNDGVEMNTQDLTRADIQRRVKTIARIYNHTIKQRFEQLGKEDWAFDPDFAEKALDVPSRFGDAEQHVNETFVIE